MKRFHALGILASIILLFATNDARAQAPYDTPFSWTGFYLGAAVGYGFGEQEVLDTCCGDREVLNLRGAQGVFSVGYDFQLSSQFVLGAFADYAFGDVEQSIFDAKFGLSKQVAVGARLGFLSGPKSLWYLTGGWTRAESESFFGFTQTVDGVFFGGGTEHAVNKNIFLKAEYRFSDYGDFITPVAPFQITNTVHSVRVGLNVKFGN